MFEPKRPSEEGVRETDASDSTWSTRTAVLATDFALECGAVLPQLEVCYTTAGRLSAESDNVVWVFHALTGSSRAQEWWPGLVGRGLLIDPDKHFMVCANTIGSCYGSTSPASLNPETGLPYGMEFPLVTMRDVVRAHALLRTHLGIGRVSVAIGGSMGGQQALEWACSDPDLFDSIVVLATNARHSPWGIACNEAQRMALQADATLYAGSKDAGQAGLGAARAMAMLTYRGYRSMQLTQDGPLDSACSFRAGSYMRHQGLKLSERFTAHAYWSLTRTMDSHNVGRDRGEVATALAKVTGRVLVVGIRSDLLFPFEEQEALAEGIPGAVLVPIDSLYGHDGFLVETAAINKHVRAFLDEER